MRDEIEVCDSKNSSLALLIRLAAFQGCQPHWSRGKMRIGQAAKELCGWEATGDPAGNIM
jgi:hypothetical protein